MGENNYGGPAFTFYFRRTFGHKDVGKSSRKVLLNELAQCEPYYQDMIKGNNLERLHSVQDLEVRLR